MTNAPQARTDRLYIDGEWVVPRGDRTIGIINPATEEVIGEIPSASDSDVDAAVVAADRALHTWQSLSWQRRTKYVSAILDYLEANAEELISTVTAELGSPRSLTETMHFSSPIAEARSQIEFANEVEWRREIGHSVVVKEPVGVVAAISAWNFPVLLILRKLAPALIAGCTVVWKPSSEVSLFAFIVARAAEAADLPAGVLNLVTGHGDTVGERLINHPLVRMISFTGSTGGGRRMAQVASEDFKRLHLELGGKSALVALPDADVRKAVAATLFWTYLNSGQSCSSLTRIVVPRDRMAEAEAAAIEISNAAVVGDPTRLETTMGPLVSARQLRIVTEYIEKGVEEGAKLAVDGREVDVDAGYFIGPTVFSQVTPGMVIEQEEIFGPVLTITPYDSVDEAIEIANGTDFGLAAGVFSPDLDSAHEVASKLKAGQIEINGAAFNPRAPFGGFKQSGIGRENGPYSIDEYLEVKSVQF